jgi:photosystem II stability/assembly factor-like uncharacterized protein
MKSLTILYVFVTLIICNLGLSQDINWEIVNNYGGNTGAINSSGDLFVGTWCVLRSQNDGDTWVECYIPNESWSVNSIAINSIDVIFVTTEGGTIYRSTDNGDTWQQLFVVYQNETLEFDDSYIDVNSEDIIYLGTYDFGGVTGVFYSNDNGDNWELTNWSNIVNNLAISPNDDIFISSYTTSAGVHRSTDNGNNWTDAATGLTNTAINDFAFNSMGYIFVGTARPNGGVFISTDNGDNWTLTGYSTDDQSESVVTALTVDHENDIFVGTFGYGIFHSNDNGESWSEINSGLPYGPIYDYPVITSFIFNAEDHILACTFNGLYRSEQPILSIKDSQNNQPITFSLNQNYPNPFNPSTKIKFALPKPQEVKIEVYNTIGQKIDILLNKQMKAGYHEVEFNAQNLSSGIYFYRIEAGEYHDVKKMIVIK